MKTLCDFFGLCAFRRGMLPLFLLLLAAGIARAEGYSQSWSAYYYMQPEPDRFVDEVRKMSKAGVLSKGSTQPGMIAFFSRVMAQNPDRVAAWMKELSDLPLPDRRLLYTSLWYSNTPEAKEYLRANNLQGYLAKQPPDILKMEPDNPATIDMLWGDFMATGNPETVRRVVSALNLGRYDGAMDKFKNTQKTEEDKKRAVLDSAYQTVRWSLVMNCLQHPKVMETCEALLKGDDLSPVERKGLEDVISKVQTERGNASKIEDNPNEEKSTVSPLSTPSQP